MVNAIEVYREAGFKAGRAVRNNDAAFGRFQKEWMLRAVALENGDDKATARKAYDEGYTDGARRF